MNKTQSTAVVVISAASSKARTSQCVHVCDSPVCYVPHNAHQASGRLFLVRHGEYAVGSVARSARLWPPPIRRDIHAGCSPWQQIHSPQRAQRFALTLASEVNSRTRPCVDCQRISRPCSQHMHASARTTLSTCCRHEAAAATTPTSYSRFVVLVTIPSRSLPYSNRRRMLWGTEPHL